VADTGNVPEYYRRFYEGLADGIEPLLSAKPNAAGWQQWKRLLHHTSLESKFSDPGTSLELILLRRFLCKKEPEIIVRLFGLFKADEHKNRVCDATN
jgi:hypothetical protein